MSGHGLRLQLCANSARFARIVVLASNLQRHLPCQVESGLQAASASPRRHLSEWLSRPAARLERRLAFVLQQSLPPPSLPRSARANAAANAPRHAPTAVAPASTSPISSSALLYLLALACLCSASPSASALPPPPPLSVLAVRGAARQSVERGPGRIIKGSGRRECGLPNCLSATTGRYSRCHLRPCPSRLHVTYFTLKNIQLFRLTTFIEESTLQIYAFLEIIPLMRK